MTDPHSPFESDHAFVEAVYRYLDGELPAEQVGELNGLLESSTDHRSLFNDIALQEHLLREYSAAHEGPDDRGTGQTDASATAVADAASVGDDRAPRRSAAIVAASLLAVSIVSAALWSWSSPAADVGPRIATVGGDVSVTDANGALRPARVGDRLAPGESISLDGPSARAELTMDSSLRISTSGPATIMWTADRELIAYRGGFDVVATTDSTWRLETPHVALSGRAAELTLLAADAWTELEVRTGNVVAAGDSGDEASTITADQIAVAQPGFPIVIHDRIERLPTEWSEDFEDGLPPGWRGEFVVSGLPEGARGAVGVATENQPLGTQFLISAGEETTRVLLTEESHLNVTFRLAAPTWFNLFVLTQDIDGGSPEHVLNRFQTAPLTARAGQWQTVRIPITEFETKQDGAFTDEPPSAGDVVVGVLFSAYDNGLDLTIDEISFTGEGPGTVTFDEPSGVR